MGSLIARKKAIMMMGRGSILPSEYQQVEWIKSDGNQYIDTGITFNHGIKISATMGWINSPSNLKALFGARTQTGNYRFFVISVSSRINISYVTDIDTNITIISNELYDFVFDTTQDEIFKYAIDGVEYSRNISNLSTNTTGYIFAYHRGNDNTVQAITAAIYKSMKIQNAEGVTLFNGIPCYRISDGEVGIYDIATNRFLSNLGTGDFIIPS